MLIKAPTQYPNINREPVLLPKTMLPLIMLIPNNGRGAMALSTHSHTHTHTQQHTHTHTTHTRTHTHTHTRTHAHTHTHTRMAYSTWLSPATRCRSVSRTSHSTGG